MITITAMKWVPPFAAGQVRDHRARWILNEVDWPYQVRLLDAPEIKDVREGGQPFGQVPILEEDGRPTLFESGAIVWDVADRAGRLIPTDPGERALTLSWVIAALNSIEPFLMNLAEARFFMSDKEAGARREAEVAPVAHQRLTYLATALGEREFLVGDTFTVADLMMASVLKIAASLEVLDRHPALIAYQARCFDRPAYRKAIEDQCATIAAHSPADMHYDQVRT